MQSKKVTALQANEIDRSDNGVTVGGFTDPNAPAIELETITGDAIVIVPTDETTDKKAIRLLTKQEESILFAYVVTCGGLFCGQYRDYGLHVLGLNSRTVVQYRTCTYLDDNREIAA